MRDEYDFTDAQQGRFYRKGAKLNLPIYLDDELREQLAERARAEGIPLGQLVNDMLRRDVASTEATKET